MIDRLNRRRVLKGMLNGGAVTVGLPFLNCFLDGNGAALASGAALPTRFGMWSWGLGMTASIFKPAKYGPMTDKLPEEIESLDPVKQHINIYTNYNVPTDGRPILC